MITIDLVTGFLGSGKTTFIRRYASFLKNKGLKVAILENDYGAANVDMLLLDDLRDDRLDLVMVSGACDADCHRRRFKTKLIQLAMQRFDRVIVEPSGVFDLDEFFDVVREDPLENWYEIGNVYCIVEAALAESLSPASEFFLGSEACAAGKILLSRVQEASAADIEATKAHLNRAVAALSPLHGASIPSFAERDFFCKDWSALTDSDFFYLLNSGFHVRDYEKKYDMDTLPYESLYYLEPDLTREELLARTEALYAAPHVGNILRIKGCIREGDSYIEINATRKNTSIRSIPSGQALLLVIGEELNRGAISDILELSTAEITE